MIDARTQQQVGLLKGVDCLFRRARIRYWLRGGWAVDFILGEVTRPHSDIDLVTWKRHERRVRQLLEQSGFVTTPHVASIDFARGGHDVNVLFVVKGSGGSVFTAGFTDMEPRWNDRALPERLYRLEGLRCRTVSPEALLEENEKTPAWLGRPARPKDLASAEILRSIIADRDNG